MAYQDSSQFAREKYINDLDDFLNTAKDSFRKFTENLGWSEMKNTCHVMSSRQNKADTENLAASKASNEYNEEPLLPCHSTVGPSGITIDTDIQQKLLAPFRRTDEPDLRNPPTAAGELIANFSREERLAMYEYTLQNAASVPPPPELSMLEDIFKKVEEPKQLSGLELAKAMRDFKRRRQAYRTKVSTKNKSHTEVAREIIHNMMVFMGAPELEQDVPQQTVDSQNVENRDDQHWSKHNEPKSSSTKESTSSHRAGEESPYRRDHSSEDKKSWRERRGERESGSGRRHYWRDDDSSSRSRREDKEEEAFRKTNSNERSDYRRTSSGDKSVFDEGYYDRHKDRKRDRDRERDHRRDRHKDYTERSRTSPNRRGRHNDQEIANKYSSNTYVTDDEYENDKKEREKRDYYSEYVDDKKRRYDYGNFDKYDAKESKYKEKDEKRHKTSRKKIKLEKNIEEGEISSSDSYKSSVTGEKGRRSSEHKKKRKMKNKKSKKKHKKKHKVSKSSHKSESESSSSDEQDKKIVSNKSLKIEHY